MVYVEYSYYKDTYKGTSIPESAFDNLALKASAFIDMITFNRINTDSDTFTEDTLECIMNAVCSVAECIKDINANAGVIASETTGNHSITYKVSDNASKNKLKYEAAYPYLANTGLLYRGV